MAKRKFSIPRVVLGGGLSDGGDVSVIGGGTGQSATDPYPCSYADWQILFADDYDLDEDIDFEDYGQWWADNGFDEDRWAELNPGVPFTWE